MGPIDPTRLFTVDEVNALIPALVEVFDRIRPDLELARHLSQELTSLGHPPPDGAELLVDDAAPVEIRDRQDLLRESAWRVSQGLREVVELGAEVKAADGLVDFRSRRGGKVVLLCWRYGEHQVGHWHDLSAGYAGRAPIEDKGAFRGELAN